jgi:EAL domain-containing protein (putative c-di-GMP-specific phosphodiesterase class I)
LIEGLDRGELSLVFQPEVSCRDEAVVGAECLIRWEAKSQAESSVNELVEAVVDQGEVDRLGEWVLRRACRAAAEWPGLFVAVNLSPLQLARPDFVDLVIEAAGSAGLPLSRLELELTEKASFADFEQAERELCRLRAAGVRIALDDFGAGQSDLTYLRRLPIDRLKIDRSYVSDLATRRTAVILESLVRLAKALDLAVTAEGVETRAQFEFLRELGCDCAQGYLFSAPVPAERLAVRLGGADQPRRTASAV